MKNNFSSFKRARLENKIAFKQQVFWEKKKKKRGGKQLEDTAKKENISHISVQTS